MSAISQRLAKLLESERAIYSELEKLEIDLHAKRRQYGRLQCSIDELIRSESAAESGSAEGSRPAPQVPETGRGFQLKPYPPRAVPMVDAIDRVLARLPHCGSL